VKPLSAISLYTGVGGLDFGFEAAGFQTRVALEMDSECVRALRANRTWPVIEGDVSSISSEEILETAGLRAGEADVLIGGPPCQPFSKSSFWSSGDTARLNDPRAKTIREYLRILEDTLPKAFLMENVEGLGFQKKGEGLSLILSTIAEINERTGADYSTAIAVLNSVDYGVPQSRRRLFIIGSREGRSFQYPLPTHGAAEDIFATHLLDPYRTAWDALWDNRQRSGPPVTGKWSDLLPSIPPGQNYQWHTERGGGLPLFGWRRRYWNFLLKLAPDRPAWTVQAQPGPATGPFHWDNRQLSGEELARLQTFPRDVQIEGSASSVRRMFGNAVPSLMAEVLAREIAKQLFDKLKGTPLTLRVERSPSPPPRCQVADVPVKYHVLIGRHEAHPGTGKGNRAFRLSVDGLWKGTSGLENVSRQ
jgi:DNA (cytosine-5)-methyltransferase 1